MVEVREVRVLPHQPLLDVRVLVHDARLQRREVGGGRGREVGASVSSNAAEPAAPRALYVALTRLTDVKKRRNLDRSGATSISFA